MSPAPENLTMDTAISFGKKNKITISKNLAILLVLAFIGCVVATGLLVFHFSSCTEDGEKLVLHRTDEINTNTENNTIDIQETSTQSFTTTTPIDNVIPDTKPNVRLPRSIKPHSYDLKLIPFFEEKNFTFQGEVTINFNVTEKTKNITLHSNELILEDNNITVTSVDDKFMNIHILNVETKKELQFIVIELDQELPIGQYRVFIKFYGVLNDVLQGFYRSSYKQNGQTMWMAATQFQATDARRAFPCFDEPALKASFKITIGRPINMNAVSNMPKIKTEIIENIPNYYLDYFEQSVPMSTYLVAFVVSDFKAKTVGNFSIWAREDAINQTLFSLEIGPKVLKYYEEFFEIPFPLPKIDMFALPDFSAGAMENWGLITFRESNLLFEDAVSSQSSKQSISIVVAHELAHQWFGNLVTPSWWTDLWLNEGFASYLEYIGTEAVHPEWKVLDQFVIFELQVVFALDALKTSHPISIEVSNPDEINAIFDRISYGKGATIIRMMDIFLTTEVFKKGLTNYLNDKMYESAQQDDLWESLTAEAHKRKTLPAEMNVKEIMDTWTLQMGFPVVNVIRNYENDSVLLKQHRFSLEETDTKSLWWIPISYTDKRSNLHTTWMKGVAEETLTNISSNRDEWLLFNVNQSGYYRVNYDIDNWNLIIAQLNKPNGYLKFDPKNRAQLIDDALNLASAKYLDYSVAMNVTTYLINEKDFVPWKAAMIGFQYIYEMFIRTGHFDKFKDYLLYLIQPLFNTIGFIDMKNDSLLTTNLRLAMLQVACRSGHVKCLLNSGVQFTNWMVSPDPDRNNPISPNLKRVIYCNGIRMGGEAEWNFAWQRYTNANVASERDVLLAALSCTRETWLLNRFLNMAVSKGSGIRKQDAPSVFAAVSRNVIGQHLAYRFLTTNWDTIKAYMGTSSMSLNGIIQVVTMNFNTEQEIDDLKSFAVKKKKDFSTSSRPINQAIEQTAANIRWMKRNFNNLVSWFESFQKTIKQVIRR